MWQWKASRGGLLGYVDDMFIGAPTEPTYLEAAGQARYQAGYWGDPGQPSYTSISRSNPVTRDRRLLCACPGISQLMPSMLFHFSDDPDSIDPERSRWWMTPEESVPYTAELDAKIPLGTVIPGVIIPSDNTGDRAHVHGGAKWEDGYWTFETVRALDTGSSHDLAFVSGQPLFMWVSAFDHTQTRHTRHMRPVKIQVM